MDGLPSRLTDESVITGNRADWVNLRTDRAMTSRPIRLKRYLSRKQASKKVQTDYGFQKTSHVQAGQTFDACHSLSFRAQAIIDLNQVFSLRPASSQMGFL